MMTDNNEEDDNDGDDDDDDGGGGGDGENIRYTVESLCNVQRYNVPTNLNKMY